MEILRQPFLTKKVKNTTAPAPPGVLFVSVHSNELFRTWEVRHRTTFVIISPTYHEHSMSFIVQDRYLQQLSHQWTQSFLNSGSGHVHITRKQHVVMSCTMTVYCETSTAEDKSIYGISCSNFYFISVFLSRWWMDSSPGETTCPRCRTSTSASPQVSTVPCDIHHL